MMVQMTERFINAFMDFLPELLMDSAMLRVPESRRFKDEKQQKLFETILQAQCVCYDLKRFIGFCQSGRQFTEPIIGSSYHITVHELIAGQCVWFEYINVHFH